MGYLTFKKANCKNCYKCLRECPVKAITVINHQAKILDEKCILCGRCAGVCPQSAKEVTRDIDKVIELIKSDKKVIVSVAPSFISSFDLTSFSPMKKALQKLGFDEAYETAIGAKLVVERYKEILEKEKPVNLIGSSCPSIVSFIQIYKPEALKYLAMVDSPMVAHAKLIKEQNPDASVVFIGPCISKKKEAFNSKVISAVLTFEELHELFCENNIDLPSLNASTDSLLDDKDEGNRSKYFPINRGVIKSFEGFVPGYEYVSIDGIERCKEALESIDELTGMFFEMNACEYACINGPCSLKKQLGSFIKSNEAIRSYVKPELSKASFKINTNVNINAVYPQIKENSLTPSDADISRILAQINKYTIEDELNCGACGYKTCKEKAWAVFNNLAEVEMCLPFMRERAESMSYEIIKNSPNGILAVDYELKIVEINAKATELLGLKERANLVGDYLVEHYNPTEFLLCLNSGKNLTEKKIFIDKTNASVEVSITLVPAQKMLFCIMKDITRTEEYFKTLQKYKKDTIEITDRVVEKQMRVVQEIASLLGETTAETKVALIKLKNTLAGEDVSKL